MTPEEFRANPKAQKQAYIFAGAFAVGVFLLVVPWPFSGQRQRVVSPAQLRRLVRRTAPLMRAAVPPAAGPQAAAGGAAALPIGPSVPPAPPATSSPVAVVVGAWQGAGELARGLCTLKLELHTIPEKERDVEGVTLMTCGPSVKTMFSGKAMSPMEGMMLQHGLRPSTAKLTGTVEKDGGVRFRVQKSIAVGEGDGCTLSAASAAPWGANMLEVEFTETGGASCGDGKMVLTKQRQ